jgi:DNA polymerase-3 subunit delta'
MKLLPWHEGSARYVTGILQAGRLPHALLLRGPAGWGDSQFADWLALTLLELPEAVIAAEDSSARTLAHPDLRWVEPEGAVIKVADIREVAHFSVGTPQAGARKVAVIEMAHQMNNNSANALLKTLEEPPPNTYILLATSQPGRLLPTVISRCQSIMLGADASEARDWLCERWDPNTVDERLLEYGNAPLAAQASLASQESALLPLLDKIARSRQPATEAQALLELAPDQLITRWFRYCVALLAGRLNVSWAAAVSPLAVAEFADELLRSRAQILFTNSVNTRLLLERLAVKWAALCQREATRSHNR